MSPLGERTNSKKFIKNSLVWLLSLTFTGAFTGFLYTALIFSITFWIPSKIKLIIFIVLLVLYLCKELHLIKLFIPQRKWQIPVEWVNKNDLKNMMIWGLILGAGIFTYIPHITFYLLYIYTGFFYSVTYGFIFGAIYGFSRALPALFIGIYRNYFNNNDSFEISRFQMIKRTSNYMTILVMIVVLSKIFIG